MVHSAGLIIRAENDQGKNRYLILLARWGNHYSWPKGHLEKGESELQCALRETEEETGFSQDLIQLEDREPVVVRYRLAKKTKRVQDGIKVVKLFYAYVKERLPVQLSREHLQYKWASKKTCLRLLRPELASVLVD